MPDAGPPGLWRLAFPCEPGLPDDALLLGDGSQEWAWISPLGARRSLPTATLLPATAPRIPRPGSGTNT